MSKSIVSRFRATAVIIAVACVCASLCGCAYFYPEEEVAPAPPVVSSSAVEYTTIPVTRGDIVVTSSLNCHFMPEKTVSLYFKGDGGYMKENHVKYGDVVQEGDILLELDSSQLQQQIEDQELAVKIAENNYKSAREGGNYYNIQNQKLYLEQAQTKLARLQEQLEETVLRAPISGKITFMAPTLSDGTAWIHGYDVMYKIADMSSFLLYATTDSPGNFLIDDEITMVYNRAQYKGTIVSAPDGTTTSSGTVYIRPEGIDPSKVSLSDNAYVTVEISRADNVLVIPRNLLKSYNTRNYVVVLTAAGTRLEKDVEVGLKTTTQVEIKSGIEEGELLIAN